jgi:nucleoside-diphosphate-sugar epimerase
MVRVVIIGGSGHVGTYLVPLLVARGYEVINVSRGTAKPYRPDNAWKLVRQITIDRKADEAENKFGQRIADLEPDIVVDMITFEPSSARQLVEAIKGKVEHYLFCSTIWVYGHLTTVPATEAEPTNPIDDYGRKKAEIEAYLMRLARMEGFPATSFRPGHIVGEGWVPVNPQGNLNTAVYSTIAAGEELQLPNLGLEMLHHVHADDVARWVLCAIDNRAASIGECFNNVSSQALTMRGYAEAMYRYFGWEPRLTYAPLDLWQQGLDEQDARTTTSHVTHSPCSSIEKSRQRLGYNPRYTSLEAVHESVRALIAAGKVVLPQTECE